MIGTYGISSASPRTQGFGAGLDGMGDQKANDAFGMARQAAVNETQLNLAKKQHEAERKAGNAQLGGTVGTMAGMAIGAKYGATMGPWGALIGGVLGAVVGRAF